MGTNILEKLSGSFYLLARVLGECCYYKTGVPVIISDDGDPNIIEARW